MKRLKRLARSIANNAGALASLLGLLGFGSALALMEDARATFADHPVPSLLLAGAAAFAGYAAATVSPWAKRKKKLKNLARCCASMSKKQKQVVSMALDEGGFDDWIYDPEIIRLVDMGILVAPSTVSRINATHLTIQPAFVLELREHREEWLS